MFSSSSNTESHSYQSDDSEWNYIPGPYNIEKTSARGENGSEMRDSSSDHEGNVGPYANGQVLTKTGKLSRKKANIRQTAHELTTTEA